MSEIGWHVQQSWYYREEYNILNMGFYFFLNSGLAAWAFGLRINEPELPASSPTAVDRPWLHGTDAVTPATPFLQASPQPILLTAEAAVKARPSTRNLNLGDGVDYFLLAAPMLTLGLYGAGAEVLHSKVPIYVMMSAIFAALTYRFWKVSRACQQQQ